MNQGLLVLLALLLLYLAVTGKYNCVTAGFKCAFGGAKLCECQGGATGGQPVAGQKPDLYKGPLDSVTETIRKAKEAIDLIRGKKATP